MLFAIPLTALIFKIFINFALKMINYDSIDSAFENIVGFRENEDVTLNSSLTTSTSSNYVNDEPGISLKLIEQSLYRYSSTSEPNIIEYLTNKRSSGIRNAIKKFVLKHKELTQSRSILSNILMPNEIPENLHADKNNRLVGIRVTPLSSKHAAILFKKIGFYFSQTNSNFPVYMWADGQKNYIKSYTVNSISADALTFADITNENWTAKFYSDYGSKISFYIGYFENDLTGSAYNSIIGKNEVKNDSVYDYKYTHFADTCGFTVKSAYLDGTNLPALENIELTNATFGIFLRFNIECDITDIIIDNKDLFSKLINLEIAWHINEDIINSPNLGHMVETMQANNSENNRAILDTLRQREIDGLSLDFTALDSYCLKNSRVSFYTVSA